MKKLRKAEIKNVARISISARNQNLIKNLSYLNFPTTAPK